MLKVMCEQVKEKEKKKTRNLFVVVVDDVFIKWTTNF